MPPVHISHPAPDPSAHRAASTPALLSCGSGGIFGRFFLDQHQNLLDFAGTDGGRRSSAASVRCGIGFGSARRHRRWARDPLSSQTDSAQPPTPSAMVWSSPTTA